MHAEPVRNGTSRVFVTADITVDEARDALKRILASEKFIRSKRSSELLTHLVEARLAGDTEKLKAFSIAIDVFGRDDSFNPDTDTLVRVQASRLREILDTYYLTEGTRDRIRISLPKGSYVVSFGRVECRPASAIEPERPSFDGQRASAASGNGQGSVQAPSHAPARKPGKSSILRHARRRLAGGRPGLGLRHGVKRLTASPRGQVTLFSVLGLLALAALAAYFGMPDYSAGKELPTGPRIGVLPVIDEAHKGTGRDGKNGLTFQLLHDLVRFKDLYVVALEDQETPDGAGPRERARAIDLEFLLRSSLRQEGDAMVLSAQVERVDSAQVMWANTYRRPLTPSGLFDAFGQMSGQVAAEVGSAYGPVQRQVRSRIRYRAQADTAAYHCMLRFYDYVANKSAKAHFLQRECLEATVKRRPDQARPWAMLSWIYGDEIRYGLNPRGTDAAKRALEAARTAVTLVPDDAFNLQYLAEAQILSRMDKLAEYNLAKAIELNPNDADLAATFAWQLAYMGKWQDAADYANKALQLSPAHPNWYRIVPFMVAYRNADYVTALSLASNRLIIDSPIGHLGQILALVGMERRQEAIGVLAEMDKAYPGLTDDRIDDMFARQRLPAEIGERAKQVIAELRQQSS